MEKPDDLQSAWDERYREGTPAWRGPLNATLDTLLRHRSIRSYADTPLPTGLLELLVAAAQSAPTSSNKQFWSVLVVRDPARKARLAELCAQQEMVAKAPLLLVWLADLSRIAALGVRAGRRLEGLDYFESFLVAALDAAFAAQNAVVAAESLGLGTVYVGAMRDQPDAVAAELKLPPSCVALFGMCIGYPSPAQAAAVKPRLPQQAVVHEEQYAAHAASDAILRHDQHYARFREEEGLSPASWSEHIMSRVERPSALQGREHLRELLHRMGFSLQ